MTFWMPGRGERVSIENNSNEVTQRVGRGRWIGLTVAIAAVGWFSYGLFRSWNKSDHVAPAGQLSAGESVVIPVEGMSCSACVARVKKTLKSVDGVGEIHVSLEKHEAEIRYEPTKISPEKLAKLVDKLGYKAGTPKMKEKSQ